MKNRSPRGASFQSLLGISCCTCFSPFSSFIHLPHTFFQLKISTPSGISKRKSASWTHVTWQGKCRRHLLKLAPSVTGWFGQAFCTIVNHLLVNPEFIYTMIVIGRVFKKLSSFSNGRASKCWMSAKELILWATAKRSVRMHKCKAFYAASKTSSIQNDWERTITRINIWIF